MDNRTKSIRVKAYRIPAQKANVRKLIILTLIVISACAAFLLINAYPEKPKLFRYILSLRIPTLAVMMIAAFAIGCASLVFQSIINNRIVTPCLLGMNSMYTLVHMRIWKQFPPLYIWLWIMKRVLWKAPSVAPRPLPLSLERKLRLMRCSLISSPVLTL